MLKYVGWADSKLPHVSYRYMRFELPQLARVTCEMILGVTNGNEFTTLKIDLQRNAKFDPLSKNIILKRYK